MGETKWASARFQRIAGPEHEGKRASSSLTDEMVGELARLGRLIEDVNIGHAIRDLRAALITWAQAIRQYPYLCGAWWDALEAVQKHGVWSKQQIESARPGPDHPTLLVPISGYPTIPREVPSLKGLACELPDRRIILIGSRSPGDECLLIVDPDTGKIESKFPLDNVPPMRHIAACGPTQILLATELDDSGVATISRIELEDHPVTRLELPEEPDGIIVLQAETQDPVILIAVQRGEQAEYRRFDGNLREQGEKQVIDVPVWKPRDDGPYVNRRLEVFGRRTWAQWSAFWEGEGCEIIDSGVQILHFDDATGCVRDVTSDRIRAATFGKRINGCCRIPDGSLVIAVPCRDDPYVERGVTFLKVDSSGEVEQPPLRVAAPAFKPGMHVFNRLSGFSSSVPLGWLHQYGLILGGFRRFCSLRLQPESLPEELTDGFVPLIPSIERNGHLSLSDGRLLLISETGALIADADPRQHIRIGSPSRDDSVASSSVLGVLRGGSVIAARYVFSASGGDDSFGRSYHLEHLGCARKLPDHMHWTRTGCLVNETSDSIEFSRSGLEGVFERLVTMDAIRDLLGLQNGSDVRLADIEQDCSGAWILLIRHDRQISLIYRDAGSNPRNVGCFDDLEDGVYYEIERFHRSAALIYRNVDDNIGSRERTWFLADSGEWFVEPQTACGLSASLLPLAGDWCLIWETRDHSEPRGGACLYRPGSRSLPVPVNNLFLTSRTDTVKVNPQDNGKAHISIAVLEADELALVVHHRKLEPHTPALIETQRPSQIELCGKDKQDRVTCWTMIDDRRIAVGYLSRRCEIIGIPGQPGICKKVVQAVGFTSDVPNSMKVSRVGKETYLVIAAGENISWFGLPEDALSRFPSYQHLISNPSCRAYRSRTSRSFAFGWVSPWRRAWRIGRVAWSTSIVRIGCRRPAALDRIEPIRVVPYRRDQASVTTQCRIAEPSRWSLPPPWSRRRYRDRLLRVCFSSASSSRIRAAAAARAWASDSARRASDSARRASDSAQGFGPGQCLHHRRVIPQLRGRRRVVARQSLATTGTIPRHAHRQPQRLQVDPTLGVRLDFLVPPRRNW